MTQRDRQTPAGTGGAAQPSHAAPTSAARDHGLTQSGFASWRVAYLHFTDDATIEDVNAEIAKRPGWEPFATRPHPDGGWWLLLKKQADE